MNDVPSANQIQTGTNAIEFIKREEVITPIDPSNIGDYISSEQINMNYCPPPIEHNSAYQIQFDQNNIQNSSPQKTPNNYNIISLFWLLNESMYKEGYKLDKYEAQFITISYNINFGNLRLDLYNIPNHAIHNNVLFLQSLYKLVSGTIYPSSCFKLMHKNTDKFTCMEQLIINTNEKWQKERPICSLEKNDGVIKLSITDVIRNETFFYIFSGWQKEAFEYSCKFVYEKGYSLMGQQSCTR